MKRILAALLLLMIAAPLWGQETRTPLHSELSYAYGFYIALKISIERIKKTFPALAADAFFAQTQFEHNFKSSFKNIEKKLRKLLGSRWDGYHIKQLQAFKRLGSQPISQAQGKAFIDKVVLRAKGHMRSPFLETFLTFNPQFEKSPAEEFSRGFTSTYRSKGHPKAKGIDFQIEYPKSWKIKEGKRPHVIKLLRPG